MAIPPPQIDPRTAEQISAQIETLAQTFTDWKPPTNGQSDAGQALIRLFSRMAALVSDRLNQSLDKNFLTFLDLIGTPIQPPQPARAPLTFTLATGATTDTLVPAGTQVAAPPTQGEAQDVVFETEQDLVVTSAQLQGVYVREPAEDRYSDRTASATGAEAAFAVFEGDLSIDHCLYLACDSVFALSNPKTVTLTVQSTDASDLAALPLTWSYWDGRAWVPLEPISTITQDQWVLTVENLPIPDLKTINEIEARWLQVRLAQPWPQDSSSQPPLPQPSNIVTQDQPVLIVEPPPIPDLQTINEIEARRLQVQLNLPQPRDSSSQPHIERITAKTVKVQSDDQAIEPDLAYFNTIPLDLSKDFYPFGEQPRFNDTLYLASQAIGAQAGQPITLNLTFTQGKPVNIAGNPEILWEAWDGSGWQGMNGHRPGDTVENLTRGGALTLTLPSSLALHTVNGETNYWMRARLVLGHYGEAAQTRQAQDSEGKPRFDDNGHPIYLFEPASYAAPSLRSIDFNFTYESGEVPLSACLTYNDFHYVDRTDDARAAGTRFAPFTATADTQPTLYLGFDQPFSNRPQTLYLQVEPPYPGEVANSTPITEPAQIIWEYASPAGWARLGAQDTTQALAKRGVIQFIGPLDFMPQSEFGRSLYWLRARWHQGQFRVQPRLRGVRTNTTWAIQAITIKHEILGSSTGNPNQIFSMAQFPVLTGQQLTVREPDLPSPAEQAVLKTWAGENALTVLRDPAGQPEEVWVRWQQVPDFHSSGPRDRHYVLDHLTGTVQFGDDQQGRVPPQGRHNLRVDWYQTGGGKQGNKPVDTITQLKTTVPYIDRVANLEAASGGANQESLERVVEQGPKALRHRGRAVTTADIEDLAYQASSEVVRAQAITPHFDPVGLQWLSICHLQLEGAGSIRVNLSLIDAPATPDLEITLHGPGQSIPYAQDRGPDPQLSYAVTESQLQTRQDWQLTLTNWSTDRIQGTLPMTYPGGSRSLSFDLPANSITNRTVQDNPYRDIDDAGRVEVIIVPDSTAQQPTPSLGLLNQVEIYLRQRCAPTLELWVTEPDWVQVTVTATIVPISFTAANTVGVTAEAAITHFLHPLTGGPDSQGWPFGRRPHRSDLYAFLESLDEVDYVQSLTVISRPSLDQADEDDPTILVLPIDRRDRFLIYSGDHQITLA